MDVMSQMMKQFNINPEKAQQAWSIAKEMGAGAHTKQQALKLLQEKGIDRNALMRIGEYLNHPAASGLASMAGVNINKIKQDFNSLLGSQSNIHPSNSKGVDPLNKYRNGLKQL